MADKMGLRERQQRLDERLMEAATLEDKRAEAEAKILIELGANPSAQAAYCMRLGPCSALLAAAARGKERMALALLAAGADPGARDENGRTAFLWAARNGMERLAKALGPLSDLALRDSSGVHPLTLAVMGMAKIGFLRALMKITPPSQADLGSALMAATGACGVSGRVEERLAGVSGRSEATAMWLLSIGAHPSKTLNADGEDALMAALIVEKEALAEAMIVHGADLRLVSRSGDTALSWAAARGAEACVRALAKECDVNQQLPDGRTPLMQAFQYARGSGAKACVDLLLAISDLDIIRPSTEGEGDAENLQEFARRVGQPWAIAAMEREVSRRKALAESQELSAVARLGTRTTRRGSRVL